MESASTVSPDDELAAFLAAPAPRRAPARLAKSARAQAGGLFPLIFGAAFGIIGLVMIVSLAPWRLIHDWQLTRADAASAPGRIAAAESTSTRINNERVWRYRFEFRSDGVAHAGASYAAEGRWRPGDAVEIQYLPENPDIAVVRGGRSSLGGTFGALALIFPGVGFGLLGWTLAKRKRAMRLLEKGRMAEAMVESVAPTGIKINKQPEYAIKLRVTDAGVDFPAVVRSLAPEVVAFAEARLASRQPVFVLYDPARPKHALLPETL